MSDDGPTRLTWIGHATALVELGGARLLTDPLLRSRFAHLRRHGASPATSALGDLDAILLSHMHLDHLDMPSLRRLDPAVPLLVPRGAGEFLRRKGCAQVRELDVGDSASVGGVRVEAVPATHDGRRHPLQRSAGKDAIGFVIDGPQRVYFAGDTDIFDEMADLAGTLDVALIPVWGWGPTLGPGHLDPERAAQATALLAPRIVVPIHWGTFYPVGLARWRPGPLHDPPHEFAAKLATLAPNVEVRLLAPGASTALNSPRSGTDPSPTGE